MASGKSKTIGSSGQQKDSQKINSGQSLKQYRASKQPDKGNESLHDPAQSLEKALEKLDKKILVAKELTRQLSKSDYRKPKPILKKSWGEKMDYGSKPQAEQKPKSSDQSKLQRKASHDWWAHRSNSTQDTPTTTKSKPVTSAKRFLELHDQKDVYSGIDLSKDPNLLAGLSVNYAKLELETIVKMLEKDLWQDSPMESMGMAADTLLEAFQPSKRSKKKDTK